MFGETGIRFQGQIRKQIRGDDKLLWAV